MQLNVKLFAVARDLAGGPTAPVELADGATVADLREALGQAVPALGALGSRLRVAVNMEFADDAQVLKHNDEVACIPPVSGG